MSLLGAIFKNKEEIATQPRADSRVCQHQYEQFVEKYKANYKQERKLFGFPDNSAFESVTIGGKHYYVWKLNDELRFYEHSQFCPAFWESFSFQHPEIVGENGTPDFTKLHIATPDHCAIKLSSIKYFYLAGSTTTKTELTGGETRVDVGAAIVGGLLLGTIGAVAMGISTTPYRIIAKTTDTRKVLLGTSYGTIEMPKEDLEALKKVMPEKYSP